MSVDALKVSCPFCASAVNEQCTRHGWPGKERQVCSNAHPSRVRKAALAAGLSDDEANTMAHAVVSDLVQRYRDRHKEEKPAQQDATVVE
jgi:hypothetical protein